MLKNSRAMKKKVKRVACPLSVYEYSVLLPIIVSALKTKKGRANAVTSTQIVEALRSYEMRINENNVCRIVNHIRMNDLIVGLMGSSAGYYIMSSEAEFLSYEESLLRREAALKKVRLCMKRQRKSMFSNLSQKHHQLF